MKLDEKDGRWFGRAAMMMVEVEVEVERLSETRAARLGEGEQTARRHTGL